MEDCLMTTALLLVDIQNDYFPGGRMELEGSKEAGLCAAEALQAFRAAGDPVFHIQHVSLRPSATFFLPDTDGVLINSLVAVEPGEPIIQKHYPNSFRETLLGQYLKEKTVTRLIIAGMMTHMCVDATVRAAFDLGYECVVLSDACATRTLTFQGKTVPAAQVHAAFLAALSSVYAEVGKTADVIK